MNEAGSVFIRACSALMLLPGYSLFPWQARMLLVLGISAALTDSWVLDFSPSGMILQLMLGICIALPMLVACLFLQIVGGLLDLSRNLSGSGMLDPLTLQPRGIFEQLFQVPLILQVLVLGYLETVIIELRNRLGFSGIVSWQQFFERLPELLHAQVYHLSAELQLLFSVVLVLAVIDLIQAFASKLVPQLQIGPEFSTLKSVLCLQIWFLFGDQGLV